MDQETSKVEPERRNRKQRIKTGKQQQQQQQGQGSKKVTVSLTRTTTTTTGKEKASGAGMRLKLKENERISMDEKQGERIIGNEHRGEDRRHEEGATLLCAGCSRPIKEKFLLEALGSKWHEDCLKCACCDCRLGEVGSSLFTHSNKILCRRDFLRIFGQHGSCAICNRSIPPYELVMRAKEKAYHIECFSCQNCQYRFCVGDKFYLTKEQRVVCILCHTENQQQQQQQQQHDQGGGQLISDVSNWKIQGADQNLLSNSMSNQVN